MPWALLDDNFPHHPKVQNAGPVAAFLYVCGLCYCRKYHTEGFIPANAVKTLGVTTNPKRLVDALVSARLWDVAENGYAVHDYQAMYDDEATKATKDERRLKRQEAGRKGGLARASNASSKTQVFASSVSQAHRNGVVEDRSLVVTSKEKIRKNIGPRDEWWQELLRRYPQNRIQRGQFVQVAFNDQFSEDERPDESIWSDMLLGLQSQIDGYEWRVKGMVPSLEKWLTEGRWRQRHERAPVSTVVSEKTARNLTAAAEFLKAGER